MDYITKAKGLKPCPICGSTDIYWVGWYDVALECAECGFYIYPENGPLASEDEFIQEWNKQAEKKKGKS